LNKYFPESIYLNSLNELDKHLNEINEIIISSSQKIIIVVECKSLSNINLSNTNFERFCNNSKLVLILNKEDYETVYKTVSNINNIDKSKIKIQQDKEYKYDDLTIESKSKLIESEIFYNNDIYILKDLLMINNINEVTDDLKSAIDLDVFHKLINIGNIEDDNEQLEKLYIERKFYRFLKIDDTIFDDEHFDDIICIRESKFSKRFDWELIKFNDIEIELDNFLSSEKRKIILSKEKTKGDEEFDSKCKNKLFKNKNIHLLNFHANGNLYWKKTNGNLKSLRKYILSDNKFKIKEDHFNKLLNLIWLSRSNLFSLMDLLIQVLFLNDLLK
jgi:nitrate reductase NapAB chaperone NapD